MESWHINVVNVLVSLFHITFNWVNIAITDEDLIQKHISSSINIRVFSCNTFGIKEIFESEAELFIYVCELKNSGVTS